jgi:hypothetical protein
MRSTLSAGVLVFGLLAVTAAAPQTVVAPEKMVPLLPQLAGWTRGEPDSQTITMGMPMSTTQVSYQQGDDSLNLSIIDTGGNQMTLKAMTMATGGAYAEKDAKGYRKTFVFAAQPGVESWDAESSTADVLLIVAGRYLVKSNASGVKDTALAKQLVEAVDIKALAALK